MKVEMRVGIIILVEEFKEVRNLVYKMLVDFGVFGVKKILVQIMKFYDVDSLVGCQVVVVVNFFFK